MHRQLNMLRFLMGLNLPHLQDVDLALQVGAHDNRHVRLDLPQEQAVRGYVAPPKLGLVDQQASESSRVALSCSRPDASSQGAKVHTGNPDSVCDLAQNNCRKPKIKISLLCSKADLA